MLRWIDRFLDRICAVIGAFALSQMPVYMQQYIQGLSGHIRELQTQVALMEHAANATGKTLSQWIAKGVSSTDPDFAKQGEILQGMVNRFEMFKDAMSAWQQANIFEKPFVFFKHLNWEIAKGTFDIFQFGFAFNIEGILYAIIGLILGYSIYLGITRSLLAIWFVLFSKKSDLIEHPKPT